MTLKQKLYDRCFDLLNERISAYQKTMNNLRDSAANETKSTAGDKHETALAMLQIEQENTNRQLKETLLQKAAFTRLDPAVIPLKVANGSLVMTSRGYFFLSVALGKVTVENTTAIALSPQSPLGMQLIGLKVSDFFEMNRIVYVIESIE